MSGPECCSNPPTLNPTGGAGHVDKIAGVNAYFSGSSHSNLAVLLLSDVFGYEAPNLRNLADKVAAAGYYVVVPDLLKGEPLDLGNPDRPFPAWIKDHGPDKGFEDTKPIIEALKSKGVSAIGAVGFCWGAKVVVELAKSRLIQAAVLLHPSFVSLDDIKGVDIPISVLAAEIDTISPPELVKQFEQVLAAKSQMSSPSNQMDSEFQETMQDSIFSTPVTNTGVDVTFPPHPSTSTGKRKQPSEVWLHFSQQPNDKRRAACNYCGTLISRNGTSTMRTHLTRCLQYPGSEKNKRRKDGPFPQAAEGQVGSGIVSSPTVFKFDQDICRTELVRMFIAAELPFRFVENEAFRQFLSVLQPRFVVISRSTLRRDIEKMFVDEQVKLKRFMSKHCGRVCLTTDTWTSVQNYCYMSLTAHFIDDDWNLQKKIINFRKVTGHSGVVIANNVELFLNEWELSQVLTITVDNATSNDSAIDKLRNSFLPLNRVILNGEYLHMRCCAHILNLIVKEGMKEIDISILRIRNAGGRSTQVDFRSCQE